MPFFDGSVLDASFFGTYKHDAGADVTVSDGKFNLITKSGYAHTGATLFTKNPIKKQGRIEVEFDWANGPHYNSAWGGMFQIANVNAVRDGSYGLLNTNSLQLWLAIDGTYAKGGGVTFVNASSGQTSFVTATNMVITHVKVIIDCDSRNVKYYMNGSATPHADITLTQAQWDLLGTDIMFEWGKGNYNVNGTDTVDNIRIQYAANKFIFQDGEDLKVYKPTALKSLSFDGNDYINLNTLSGKIKTGDPFSFTTWFKTTYRPGTPHGSIIFSVHSSGNDKYLRLGIPNTTGIFYSPNEGSSDQRRGDVNYADGQWHHLALTIEIDGLPHIYVDGVEIVGYFGNRPNFTSATKYSIGQEWDSSPSDYYQGKLSDAKIFKRVLTPEEVISEFNREVVDATGLLVHWDFMNANSNLKDPNGIANGTLVGATYSDDVPSDMYHWVTVGVVPATKELFETQGMDYLLPINNFAIQKLTSNLPELLCWTDEIVSSGDVIPTLTSNVGANGAVISSSEYSGLYAGWKAFNDSNNGTIEDTWETALGQPLGWLGYSFNSPQIINSYSVSAPPITWSNRAPKSWVFEGSDDGLAWNELHSVTGELEWGDKERRIYTFSNETPYNQYRINVTEKYGTDLLSIAELEMFKPQEIAREATFTASPHPQLLISSEDIIIEGLDNFSITVNQVSDFVRIAISSDEGITWNGKATVNLADLEDVKTNGYTLNEFNALVISDWKALVPEGKVRFAFYLEQNQVSDATSLVELKVGAKTFNLSPELKNVRLIYETMNVVKPTFYVSRNDGVDWKEIKPDELTALNDLPEGNQLRVKAILSNGQELHAISYSWI